MHVFTLAADAPEATGNPALNITIFGVFIVITLYIVTRAGKTTSESADFYTGYDQLMERCEYCCCWSGSPVIKPVRSTP